MTPKEKKRLKYYTNRFKTQESEVNNLTVAQQKKLISVYKETAKGLESDLAVFLEKYSRANKLESADLKRMLNTQELANFRYTIKGYVDEIERLGKDTLEGKALKKELDILAGRTRVSRMQELRTQIETEINKATLTASNIIKNHLIDVVDYSYTDTIEILKNNTLARLDTKTIQRIVAQKWSGKNYSSRIWDNRKALLNKVMKTVVSGIAQGHDYIKMTEKLQEKMKSGYFETRRLIHTETTFALERAKEQAYKELGVKKCKFIAVMDKDTSPICQKLNGQEFEMKDRQQGVNCPPMHPFCRSVTVAIVDLKKYIKQEDKKSGIIELNTRTQNDTIRLCIAEGIDYRGITKRDKNIPELEIIKRVGGGDKTQGSCSSLAFTYAGNKAGYDVLDFRDGKSRRFFSSTLNINRISQLEGVNSWIVRDTNDFRAVKNLFANVVEGKEYYLATGRHAAIVRKVQGQYYYLELQAPNESNRNGFHELNDLVLKYRFSCQKSHHLGGRLAQLSNCLIEIESLGKSDDFKQILGFINTDEKMQVKGSGGVER